MWYKYNVAVFIFVNMCLCVVSCRNVENIRIKTGINDTSCESLKEFYKMMNISTHPFGESKGNKCGGHCCSPETETFLRSQGQKEFATLLRHNSRSLQGLLASIRSTLQRLQNFRYLTPKKEKKHILLNISQMIEGAMNHLLELTKQSENATLQLSAQVYRTMFSSTKGPINILYSDISRFIQLNVTDNEFNEASVTQFFISLFPVAYHHAIEAPSNRDFTSEYKACLKQKFNDIQAFGDIPRQVAQSLYKSLDSTRLLLNALQVGIGVLNETDTLVLEDDGKGNVGCHDALMKMIYCPKCLGLTNSAKPCCSYCLNVLRGCLSKYIVEMDSPWNGYVEGIERLVTAIKQHNNERGHNADYVIRGLDTKISEAIMHVIIKKLDIENKVKRACGPDDILQKVSASTAESNAGTTTSSPAKQRRVFPQLPIIELNKFLSSIDKSKSFYDKLVANICEYDSFAERSDQHCWNGERIGEYTRTVMDMGLQKYNPEVKPNTDPQNVDSRVANLADKLRQTHQVVIQTLGSISPPEPYNFMQGDGAEGSGSGHDEDDDNDNGSGSGDESDEDDDASIGIQSEDRSIDKEVSTKIPTGGSSFKSASFILTSVFVLFNIVSKFVA